MTNTIHTPKDQMPQAIDGADGRTYYRTRFTGETLSACAFGEGHTSYEYWAFEPGHAEDTFRLHAITATQFWLD